MLIIQKVDQREGSLAIVHKDEQMPMVCDYIKYCQILWPMLTFNAWLVSSFQVDGFLEGFVEAAAFHLWAGLV